MILYPAYSFLGAPMDAQVAQFRSRAVPGIWRTGSGVSSSQTHAVDTRRKVQRGVPPLITWLALSGAAARWASDRPAILCLCGEGPEGTWASTAHAEGGGCWGRENRCGAAEAAWTGPCKDLPAAAPRRTTARTSAAARRGLTVMVSCVEGRGKCTTGNPLPALGTSGGYFIRYPVQYRIQYCTPYSSLYCRIPGGTNVDPCHFSRAYG